MQDDGTDWLDGNTVSGRDQSGADTIFAMASGAGRAAVAVLRMSGAASGAALLALAGDVPQARRASLRRLRNPEGETLDEALVLWMPGPGSYTGEDSVELHLHAGRAVIDGVAAALVAAGARPAEPGEFTRRAFLNGRMELTAAEAVADLIAAETDAQRRQALRQMAGTLDRLFDGWATRLRRLLARHEAVIDFPDETSDLLEETGELASLIAELEAQIADRHRGERLRDGLTFVVSGPPNVGKSSLVNALVGRDAAIVSPYPGTTRDVIEIRTAFAGVPVTLVDTAGLHDSEDQVELEGMRRAREQAAQAHLVLAVEEAGTRSVMTQAGATVMPQGGSAPALIEVSSKIDLAPAADGRWGVSVLTGEGLETLRARLDDAARELAGAAGSAPLTRARHRAACTHAIVHLRAAMSASAVELRAEELRLAVRSLGRVTGRVGVEDILDDIFSEFCIGK